MCHRQNQKTTNRLSPQQNFKHRRLCGTNFKQKVLKITNRYYFDNSKYFAQNVVTRFQKNIYVVCTKSLGTIFYNCFGHAWNWVSLTAFKVLSSCIAAPLQTPLPLPETVLLCLFSGIAHSSVCAFSVISLIVRNRRPFKAGFSLGNKKKSTGARSGE